MGNTDDPHLSRRNWLGVISSASIGGCLLASKSFGAQPPGTSTSSESDLGARTYSVRDFGAKGDGVTLDTAALQAAIDKCHQDRGGTVVVPAGVFVIGTVELKSNVT